MIYLDMHNLVTRQIAQDNLPRDLGHAHELVGAPYEEGDAIAFKVAQFWPELQHRIDGLVIGLGCRGVRHILVVIECQDVDGIEWHRDGLDGRWGRARY